MFMKENWQREKSQKVISIDIDGILADYPKCWVDWVNTKINKSFNNLEEMKNELSYSSYRKLKKEYRTCGIKAKLPAVKDATIFIQSLRKAGYKIIILTSRPYRMYREIYNDTIQWLADNKILYDGIIWESQKHWAVLQEFPYLKFMVEDNAEISNQVARFGYKVYLLDNEYNQQPLENCCQRVFSLRQILKCEGVEIHDKKVS